MDETLRVTIGDAGSIAGELDADLTGVLGVEAHILAPGGTVIERPCTVTDAEGGGWSFTYVGDTFAVSGLHLLEIEVTYSDGRTQTFKYQRNRRTRLSFLVEKQIA